MNIRKETPDDHEAVRNVHIDAFGEKHGEDVAKLVERIRSSGDRYVDDFSLVAEKDGEVVGHVLLSYVDLVNPDGSVKRILSLSPLGVVESHEGRGIGGDLVNAALGVAEERHEPLITLEGLPGYYPRFGFEPAHEAGIHYPAHVAVAAAMVKKLTKYNPSIKGKIEYPEAFDHLEHHTPSNTSENTASDYDTEAEQAEWDSPKRAQKLVEKYVVKDSKVLDLGIGTGQAVEEYREKGAAVIGIDSDQKMLDKAQTVTGDAGIMLLGDINKPLPIEGLEDQIDVAQAIGVLEFAEDIEGVFDQVQSVLKKDGVFVFTIESSSEDAKKAEHYPEAGVTVHRHSVDEIQSLLIKKGFSLLHNEAYEGYTRGDAGSEKVPYAIFLAQKINMK